jgi:hypothetical protein
VHRFLPKVFWLFGQKTDRFGASEDQFQDYAGRSVLRYGPQLVSALRAAKYNCGYVLPPGNLLGAPNSDLVFQLRERSDFSVYWQGYPRRRHNPAKNGAQATSPETDSISSGAAEDIAGGEARDQ